MNRQSLQTIRLPDAPGVYFFMRGKTILYIGKASSLRSRVHSYFADDLILTRGPRIVDMVTKATDVKVQKTDSVLEALLLEAELIKKHQPPYNTDGKDDKSYNCVTITDEDFPRVVVVRSREVDFSSLQTNNFKLKTIFGPFPHGYELKEALKIIRRIFPYRDEKCMYHGARSMEHGAWRGNKRGCFNYQIGLCPGVCVGAISRQEYARTIRRITLLFRGKKIALLRELSRDMREAAKRQEFERAGGLKRTLFALRHIQDVALMKRAGAEGHGALARRYRIEAYDAAHLGGKSAVGVMAVVADGAPLPSEYRTFNIRGKGNDDVGSLTEILARRLRHPEWKFADLVVVDGGAPHVTAARRALALLGRTVPIVAVVKDERHKPKGILGLTPALKCHEREILLANAEAHRFSLKRHRTRSRRTFLLSAEYPA
ncbi:MAG: Uncharacterized protein G01um101472_273 [Parcubacteria group bacterium Gr01-1014_72]|nr:MAG: Uncharacterized protein G01um101472_273 [Parcubacteria group bacterium Gr01-1014_72]